MPSYLEKEQIQSLQPMISNTGAILNTFQTKLSYWGAGAAQLKNAYERYLGMDLLREDNKDRLKGFMSQAKDQMKKAVQSDLSVGDNQVQALGIFDPLVNGQNDFSKAILGDNAMASHYKSEMATAESYRTREGGKEYSDANVQYLMQHVNDFQNDPDASNWSKYYSKRRFYSPYYDYNKEIKEVMATYKPSEATKTVPTNGMYFRTVEDKSTTKQDALRYIAANLSDRAKRQLGIESSVNWYGRDEDLIKSVRADWDADIAKYTDYKQSLEAKHRVEDDPVRKAEMAAEMSLVERRVAGLQDNVSKFNKGDLTEVTSNRDSYANKLFINNFLDSVATGYTRVDQTDKYSVDQAGVQTMLETGRNSRFVMEMEYNRERDALDRQTALDVANIRADGTKKDTPGTPEFPIPKPGDSQGFVPVSDDDKTDSQVTLGTLDKDKSEANAEQVKYFDKIHNSLVNQGLIQKSDDPKLREKVASEYLTKMDNKYKEFSAKYKDSKNVLAMMEYEFFPGVMDMYNGLKETNQKLYTINKVKEELAEKSMNDFRGMASRGKTTINYVGGKAGESNRVYIAPERVMDFVVKGDRSVIEERPRYSSNTVARGDNKALFPQYQTQGQAEQKLPAVSKGVAPGGGKAYYYNGRELDADQFNSLIKDAKASINKKYSSDQVDAKAIWKFGPNSKIKMDVANSEIMSNIAIQGKELKATDYQILGYAEDGTIYFKSSGDIIGHTYKGEKDSDGRRVYGLKSPNFEINTAAAVPANSTGVKYFVDKFIPFLKAGESKATPIDENFYKIGNTSFQVEFQRSPDLLTVNYTLFKIKDGKRNSLGIFEDVYSLFAMANATANNLK
jgi:hypothetical protein